ncbi:MAG: isoprenylcysteine carboxylmethyltransferase family protein [Planctomycetes bacterium]|nr:isoprenylcysteine carboxylmethyltransferase family protein [Planctomycetota bacterium]
MGRFVTLIYGLICYAIFFLSFLYAIAFIGNITLNGIVPKTIDSGTEGDLTKSLFVNALLLGLFAIQHSVMARQGFKKWWTQIIPKPAERSTYVLLSSLLLCILYWQWEPLLQPIWTLDNETGKLIIQTLFWFGWGIVLISTFMINHFELFGLQQVFYHAKGKEFQYPSFRTPALYKFIRHPIMLGFIIAFWAAPKMTLGHLIFSVATTGYIFIGIMLEERDLVSFHGEKYKKYKKEVSMILPIPKSKL